MVYLVFHAEPQLWAWDCLMKCGELGVGRQVKREGVESRFHVTTEVVIFFPPRELFSRGLTNAKTCVSWPVTYVSARLGEGDRHTAYE